MVMLVVINRQQEKLKRAISRRSAEGRAGGSVGNGDPLEAVRSHPRFDEQRRLIQSNPKNITAVLSQIFQLQPEVAHVLRDKHGADAFIEMMDPLAFAARFGATGSPAPTGRPAEAKVASNASAEESDTEEKETVPTKLAAPNGATCYFCLDEGLDESGKPPVRDCSCRGNSAGFAHLSCMIEYAKQKSNQAAGKDFDKFTEPWYQCPNCKQQFKSQLSLDLTSAFVSFADATYGHPGNSYNDNLYADKYVRLCKKRYVVAMPWNKIFQALRYDDDGDICVTEGQLDDEREDRFTNDLIFPNPGCPVVCHGLVSALHLNGKLGEVKNFVNQPAGTRLEVHFDDKSQKPVFVKPENLRIAFELDEFFDRRDD